jgi:hypothetical protein
MCLLFAVAAALSLQGSPRADTASTDPFTMAKWEMFKRGTSEGHLAYVRGNTALRALQNRQRFPYRAGFAVMFSKPNEFGLPGTDEASELTGVENEIDRAMSGKKLGFLSLVITTGGMREYVFYTGRPDDVRKLMKKMGGKVRGREFRSYVVADPGWDVYFRFTQ